MPDKKPPKNVLKLIADAVRRKQEKESKKPTLAKRYVRRKKEH